MKATSNAAIYRTIHTFVRNKTGLANAAQSVNACINGNASAIDRNIAQSNLPWLRLLTPGDNLKLHLRDGNNVGLSVKPDGKVVLS